MSTMTICGRPYQVAERTTIRQDRALELALKAAGVFEKQEGESDEDLFRRVYSTIIDSGVWAEVLACRLVPVGEKWSQELKALTVVALDEMDDPAEKTAIAKLIPWVVASFFMEGILSQSASRAYSSAAGEGVPQSSEMTIRLGRGERWPVRFLDSILCAWRAFWIALLTKRAPATSNS